MPSYCSQSLRWVDFPVPLLAINKTPNPLYIKEEEWTKRASLFLSKKYTKAYSLNVYSIYESVESS